MTLSPPRPADQCPDSQEALSRFHALDTFAARFLTSGRIAVYDRKGTFLGVADSLADIEDAVTHLCVAADRARQQAEAERLSHATRAAEAAALANLELDLEL